MPNPYKYRNLNFFSYNPVDTANFSDAGKRTLSDWNRHVRAGDKCPYYINGVQLSALRNNQEFKDVAELKNFFKTHIFKNMSEPKSTEMKKKIRKLVPGLEGQISPKPRTRKIKAKTNDELAEMAAEQACLHWHQAGIQHATYQHLNKYALSNYPNIKIAEPEQQVNFDTVPGGVKITEENTIRHWTEVPASGTQIKQHIRREDEAYYAKTETSYFFTPEVIKVQELIIDCPSSALAPILDKRSQSEQKERVNSAFLRGLYDFVSKLMGSSGIQTATEDIPTVEPEKEAQTHIELPKL